MKALKCACRVTATFFFMTLCGFSVASGQTLTFPHMADGNIGDGTRWATEIDLANSTATNQTATVSFFNPDGTPKIVAYERGAFGSVKSASTVTFTLIANGMKVITLDTAAADFNPTYPVNTGWIMVEGSSGIKGTLLFRRIQYRRVKDGVEQFDVVITEAGVLPAPQADRIDFIPRVSFLAVNASDPNVPNQAEVGYALANPSSTATATGEIQLWDANTGLIATSTFSLSPRSQRAEFVNERFGAAAKGQYVRVRLTTGMVSGVALRLYSNGLISTISVN